MPGAEAEATKAVSVSIASRTAYARFRYSLVASPQFVRGSAAGSFGSIACETKLAASFRTPLAAMDAGVGLGSLEA